jgi:hypothetical protein
LIIVKKQNLQWAKWNIVIETGIEMKSQVCDYRIGPDTAFIEIGPCPSLGDEGKYLLVVPEMAHCARGVPGLGHHDVPLGERWRV